MQINRSNRQFGLLAAMLATTATLVGKPARAQDQTPYTKINAATEASPVVARPVRSNVTFLDGAGGNVAVLAGKDGLLLVDAGIAVSRAKMEAALTNVRPGPLNFVVNTHWHWDHTDGNGWAHEDGAVIIAHPNTARHFGETIRVVEWGHTFDPVAASYRPAQLVETTRLMTFNGEAVEISPYMRSHTDGDLMVYFRNADVLTTGDTFWNGYYPFIDYVAGGSIDGMIAASNANIAKVTDNTLVIPGHGPVGRRAELIAFRDMLVTIRDRVARLKAQGMTLEQAIAAKPTSDFDAKWGTGVITPALMTGLAYRGVGD